MILQKPEKGTMVIHAWIFHVFIRWDARARERERDCSGGRANGYKSWSSRVWSIKSKTRAAWIVERRRSFLTISIAVLSEKFCETMLLSGVIGGCREQRKGRGRWCAGDVGSCQVLSPFMCKHIPRLFANKERTNNEVEQRTREGERAADASFWRWSKVKLIYILGALNTNLLVNPVTRASFRASCRIWQLIERSLIFREPRAREGIHSISSNSLNFVMLWRFTVEHVFGIHLLQCNSICSVYIKRLCSKLANALGSSDTGSDLKCL